VLARNSLCFVLFWLIAGQANAEDVTVPESTLPDASVTAEEPSAQGPQDTQGKAQQPVISSSSEPETVVSLEDVHVTATHPTRNDRDFPGTASVIDTEEMERRLMRTIKDIVRYEPNVNVQNDPQRFGQSGFNIRGVSGNRVLTMVDGVRVPDSFAIGSFQSAGRNYVDVDSLKAAEIVRGPASALYSSDGIGGVVSFMTKDPADYLDLFDQNNYEALKLMYNSANESFLQTGTLAGRVDGWDGLLLLTHADGAEFGNMGSNDSKSNARTPPIRRTPAC
jgi:hemoglobin/transferrin/lactoferrin receptor protein